MTREELVKHWEYMKAYKDGRDLELFDDMLGKFVPITKKRKIIQ